MEYSPGVIGPRGTSGGRRRSFLDNGPLKNAFRKGGSRQSGIGAPAALVEAFGDEIRPLVQALDPARDHAELLEPEHLVERACGEADHEAVGDRLEHLL